MDLIESKLRRTKIKLHLPLWYMKFVASVMDLLPFPMPLSRDQLKMLAEDNTCDPKIIQSHFGFAPQPFKEWLATLAL